MPIQSKKVHGCKSKHTTSWELANFTSDTNITSTWSKRQFRHKNTDSCRLEEQEEVSKWGRTTHRRMANSIVSEKCWSVRCERGRRENLYLKTPTIVAALPRALGKEATRHNEAEESQWENSEWKTLIFYKDNKENVLWTEGGRMGKADHDRSPIRE